MAESKLNSELGLGSAAAIDAELDSPMASEANKGTSLYEMYPVGWRKPYCLQLEASLVEVIDTPLPPAHAWQSEIVTNIVRAILPDLHDSTIVGDGMAILSFGSRAFREGLAFEHAEIYANRLMR